MTFTPRSMIGLTFLEWVARRHNAKRLAEMLQVDQSLISKWRHEDRPIPAEYVLSIEALTSGLVRAETLRPDLYWRRSRLPKPQTVSDFLCASKR